MKLIFLESLLVGSGLIFFSVSFIFCVQLKSLSKRKRRERWREVEKTLRSRVIEVKKDNSGKSDSFYFLYFSIKFHVRVYVFFFVAMGVKRGRVNVQSSTKWNQLIIKYM